MSKSIHQNSSVMELYQQNKSSQQDQASITARMTASIYPPKYQSREHLEQFNKAAVFLRPDESIQIKTLYPDGYQEINGADLSGQLNNELLPSQLKPQYQVGGVAGCGRQPASGHTDPLNNMGPTGMQTATIIQVIDDQTHLNADFDDGTELIEIHHGKKKDKAVLVRLPKAEKSVISAAGFVDQVSFTVYCSDLIHIQAAAPYANDGKTCCLKDTPYKMSTILNEIFGFGITMENSKGINFYKQSFTLGDSRGVLAYGGQKDTINVQIYGNGCLMAVSGWELRLHAFLTAVNGRLTRIDCAHDYFDGSYTPDLAKADYLDGKFSLTNRKPLAEQRGDWFRDGGAKTFYVGSRSAGKLIRIYDKGKQIFGKLCAKTFNKEHKYFHLLGWVRIETEWHNTNRILPLDMLLNPGRYLAGSCPAFSAISEVQEVVTLIKYVAVATVEKAISNAKRIIGNTLTALVEIYGRELALDLLLPVVVKYPAWAVPLLSVHVDDERTMHYDEYMAGELAKVPF